MITQTRPTGIQAVAQTSAPPPRSGGSRLWLGTALGTVAMIAIWAYASQRQPELILPSPLQTWRALVDLVADGTVHRELARTLGRSATGIGLAFAIGIAWGAVNGTSRWFGAITQPLLSTLMALPPVVLVALGMVWLGPGATVTRLVVTLVALPLIVIAVQEAVRAVDTDLLEMARSFELSRWARFRHVIAPSIASPVLAATSVTIGQALRVAVMAELLSAASGVGAEIALARTNLATADLFAWSFVLITMVIVIEALVLRPITARLLRWRTNDA